MKKTNESLKAVIYARYSSDNQREESPTTLVFGLGIHFSLADRVKECIINRNERF